METIALAAVLLLALLVGLAIPVLLQLRTTLTSAQRVLESTSAKTDRALADVALLTARIGRVVDEIEVGLPRVHRALDAADSMVGAVDQVRGSLRIATAVGPAAFAVVKSLIASFMASRTRADERQPEPEEAEEAEEQTTSSQLAAAS